MNLIGKEVTHNKYGEGVVIGQDGEKITVKFNNHADNVVFGISASISLGILRFKNDSDKEEYKADMGKNQQAEIQKRNDEFAKSQQRIIDRANSSTKVARTPSKSRKSSDINATPSNAEKHIAFKCNYCDGGANANSIGFKDVCSDNQIAYNIQNHSGWCTHPDCPCRQYTQGKITRTQLNATHTDGNFTCYESGMLVNWMAAAGEDRDGKPRKILYAEEGKIAVLTTVLPNTNEEDRVIFAVFLIGKAFKGDDVNSGYVVGKEGFTIELTPDEAKQLKFWNYYKNKNSSIAWRQGLFHYLTKDICKTILEDIIKIKGISSNKVKTAQYLLAYV